jgi:hypothetical protein
VSIEHDAERRLRDRASQALSEYRTDTISLRRLIDTLDSVWSSFEPSEWRDEFRGHWWTLEQIYSVALDSGNLANLSRDEMQEIEEALNELDILIG